MRTTSSVGPRTLPAPADDDDSDTPVVATVRVPERRDGPYGGVEWIEVAEEVAGQYDERLWRDHP